jgi:hypothetical protein
MLELEATELLLRIDELLLFELLLLELLLPTPFILGSSGLLNSNEVQENV